MISHVKTVVLHVCITRCLRKPQNTLKCWGHAKEIDVLFRHSNEDSQFSAVPTLPGGQGKRGSLSQGPSVEDAQMSEVSGESGK